MDPPDIKNVMRDDKNKITYVVMAYRRLSEAETIGAIRFYLSKQKRPPRGTTVTIITVIE